MNKYTKKVIASAKRDSSDLSAIQAGATMALQHYILLVTDWPPIPAVGAEKNMSQEWWDSVTQTVLGAVHGAWMNPGRHENIRQLAALYGLGLKLYPDPSRHWSDLQTVLMTVGNELGTWQNWPELHDVQRLFPLPSAGNNG